MSIKVKLKKSDGKKNFKNISMVRIIVSMAYILLPTVSRV